MGSEHSGIVALSFGSGHDGPGPGIDTATRQRGCDAGFGCDGLGRA